MPNQEMSTDRSEPALHSTARSLAVICVISSVLRMNPFHTSSTVSPTCAALSNTRVANSRCFRTWNGVSTRYSSGLQGGGRSRETLAGICGSLDRCQLRRGRRRHDCPWEPALQSPGDGGSSLRSWSSRKHARPRSRSPGQVAENRHAYPQRQSRTMRGRVPFRAQTLESMPFGPILA